MNLAALRRRTRRLSGMHSPDLLPDADLDDLVNEVYLDALSVEDWPFLRDEQTVPLVAGTSTYTLTPPLRTVASALVGGERLWPTVTTEMEREPAGRDGEPVAYARTKPDELVVYPTPDAPGTISLVGQKAPTPLEADTDEPGFDSDFHVLLAYEAAARLLIEEGDDSGRVEGYQRESGAKMESMRTRYLRSHDAGLFVMGGRATRRRRVGL